MTDFFEGREILITGGTGSLGKTLVKLLLAEHRPKGIRIFSRDELKQWQMASEIERFRLKTTNRITGIDYLVGDIRNLARLKRAFAGVDIIVHAAAMKQLPTCERNPQEAIETNIQGSSNVMNASIDCGVGRVMYANTDKAVKPVNLYGATKMVAEKLFVDANVYTGGNSTKFACCRYGNVLGSRGSVAHVFKEQAEKGESLSITHKAMSRFWITIPAVSRFILARVADMRGGEVFVPKMKTMGIFQMAHAMGERERCECNSERQGTITCPWCDGTYLPETIQPTFTVTGIRQGEKLHEMLFHSSEYVYDIASHDYYIVLPRNNPDIGKAEQWELTSDKNPAGELSRDELFAMLQETDL